MCRSSASRTSALNRHLFHQKFGKLQTGLEKARDVRPRRNSPESQPGCAETSSDRGMSKTPRRPFQGRARSQTLKPCKPERGASQVCADSVRPSILVADHLRPDHDSQLRDSRSQRGQMQSGRRFLYLYTDIYIYTNTYTRTHTHIYIYNYIYI